MKLDRKGVSILRDPPAAFRRLCVETATEPMKFGTSEPAAFRRLCVETPLSAPTSTNQNQPPSGGCVLKHKTPLGVRMRYFQPPSGGCVLKQSYGAHPN